MITDLLPLDLLWRNALAVVPLALIVAVLCRIVPCRPSTRHSLWLVVLVLLVASPVLPVVELPRLPDLPDISPARAVDVAPPDAHIIPHPPEDAVDVRPPPPIPAARYVFGPPVAFIDVDPPPARRGRGGAADSTLIEPSGKGGVRAEARGRGHRRAPPTQPGVMGSAATATRERVAAQRSRPAPVPATEPRRDAVASPVPFPRVAPRVQFDDVRAPISGSASPSSSSRLKTQDSRLLSETAWRQWTAQLGTIRDEIMRLPPIPAVVWVAGIVLLLLVAAFRVGKSMNLVRQGTAAPPSTARMVGDIARQLGLRRPPETLVVDARVSPMLWCGRRTLLILPRGLWAQLDDIGRRAVICHELAHLRRRDHWICRVEMIIGWMYWWHPIVWWVRRRLHDEADLCCDAWVTSLLPAGRRAYAQALLEARKYSGSTPHAVPSVGLGVMTLRAKRFARRLTMVMTEQTSPRLSRKGTVLAGMLALLGVMVTPLWACPPAPQEDANCKPKRAKAPKPPKVKAPKLGYRVDEVPGPPALFAVPAAPTPPAPPEAAEPPSTTFERYMEGQGRGREMRSIEERIRRLEEQIQILNERIQRLRSGFSTVPMPGPSAEPTVYQIEPLAAYSYVLAQSSGLGRGRGPSSGDSTLGACLRGGGACSNEVVVRAYQLPGDKLDELTALMIRDDVPLRVRRDADGRLEVHATEAQHCVFDAFCRMIAGDEKIATYRLPEGQLEALTELMVRSDVPILVEPGREDIKVHGSELEQAVFGAFVRMIGPGSAVETRAMGRGASELAEMAERYESQAGAQVFEIRALHSAVRSLESHVERLEREAERIHDRAQHFEDKADELADEADEYDERADDEHGRTAGKYRQKADEIRRKADEIRSNSEMLHMQAEELLEQAETLREEAEQIREQIEELEESGEHEGWDDDGGDDDGGWDDDDDDWDDEEDDD